MNPKNNNNNYIYFRENLKRKQSIHILNSFKGYLFHRINKSKPNKNINRRETKKQKAENMYSDISNYLYFFAYGI